MADSADTARERLAAKRKPKPVPRKPSADARAFGAATAIFVPPELQNEGKVKPAPKSVVVKSIPKGETLAEKRSRQKSETEQRERARLGLRITAPTGANRLDAVPPKRGKSPAFSLDPFDRLFGVGKAVGAIGEAAGRGTASKLKDWGGDIADIPENMVASLFAPTDPRVPLPATVQRIGKTAGTAEPLVRPLKETSEFLATEKGQEEIWGKSLVNLVLHGDLPDSSKGQWAGMSVGILGILPFGKLTQLAKAGRAAKAAGKLAPLPDTPERTAWRAALSAALGEEQADNAMIASDNLARNLAKKGEDPSDFYRKTEVTREDAAKFMASPAAKRAQFQTGAGPRQGLVEGGEPPAPLIAKVDYNPKAAFRRANSNGDTVYFRTAQGFRAAITKVDRDKFKLTLSGRHGDDVSTLTMDEARETIRAGRGHHVEHDVAPVESTEVPVFYSELKRQVDSLPPQGHSRAQTEAMLRGTLDKSGNILKPGAVKLAEWTDTGMQDFFNQYPPDAKIPKADIQRHLASSLNAYDLDEIIRIGVSQDFPARFGPGNYEGLTVRDDSLREPYYEITMFLRTPLHREEVPSSPYIRPAGVTEAPYHGKGADHWRASDVVAHVRFHVVNDAEGKRALIVDEIQSDWASDWRRKNAVGGREGILQRMEDLREEGDRIRDRIEDMELQDHLGNDPLGTMAQRQDLEDALTILREREMELNKLLVEVPGPPPLGKKQREAAVRRVLRFAQEENVDRIIIVQGDVQNVRNVSFRTTPKGRPIGLHDEGADLRGVHQWEEDVAGMGQGELKSWARDESLHGDNPMWQTFNRLYGTDAKPRGEIAEIFEKEMGEKGGLKEEIFTGSYADQFGGVERPKGPIEGVRKFRGKLWVDAPDYQGVISDGDIVRVRNTDKVGSVKVDGDSFIVTSREMSRYDAQDLIRQVPTFTRLTENTQKLNGYVIEMTDAAKAKAAKPMAYYQKRQWEKLPKGATEFFADGTRAIRLFEGADISTVLHELAHVALADLNEVDRAILARNFGNFAKTSDHEAYARAVERYFYEGSAATSELDGVFAKLKVWMQGVYQHVNNIGAHVNPEVKQVFDRMFVQPESPAESLVRMLKDAPAIRKAQDIGYSEERARRIGNAMEALTAGEGEIDGFYAALTELKGELPKIGFTGLDELSPEALSSLLETIRLHPFVRPYEKIRAMDAIIQATRGSVPTTSELVLLDRIFGKTVGFRKNVRPSGFGAVIVEIWNIPRSFAASFDLSAPLRQGIVAGFRHPIIFKRNILPMIKSIKASKYEDYAEEIATRPSYPLMKRAKLAVDTSASDADFAMREEAFYSSYADKLPGVKHSARAYETFLHRMRADIFDEMLAKASSPSWMRRNVPGFKNGGKLPDPTSDEFLQGLGRYINSITGRGVLPENVLVPAETAAPLLNTIFFSPRLLASRVNLISPRYYYKLWQDDPMLALEAMRAMVHSVGGTLMVLGVASQMPGVSVGLDPTSANFGKIRVGDTRVDTLAGFGPLAVLIARMATGKSTSSASGMTQNLKGGFGASSHYDILQRFAESKFAPTTSMGRDILSHQTYLGQELGWNWDSAWVEGQNLIPMMFRDAVEVAKEPKSPEEAAAAFATVVVLGGLGIGFSSYPNRAAKSGSSSTTDPDGLPVEPGGGGEQLPVEPGYQGDGLPVEPGS